MRFGLLVFGFDRFELFCLFLSHLLIFLGFDFYHVGEFVVVGVFKPHLLPFADCAFDQLLHRDVRKVLLVVGLRVLGFSRGGGEEQLLPRQLEFVWLHADDALGFLFRDVGAQVQSLEDRDLFEFALFICHFLLFIDPGEEVV